jgi:hypothetical protein
MSPSAGYHRLLDAVQLTTAEFNSRYVQTYISLPRQPEPGSGVHTASCTNDTGRLMYAADLSLTSSVDFYGMNGSGPPCLHTCLQRET